jgi:hypothetical protein
LLLKQHNIIDGFNTIALIAIIWFSISHSNLPAKCDATFSKINILLGIEAPKSGSVIHPHRQGTYTFKTIIYWFLFVVCVLYLLLVFWNFSLGGMFELRVLGFITPAAQSPTYTSSTIYVVQDSWRTMW